MFLTVSSKY